MPEAILMLPSRSSGFTLAFAIMSSLVVVALLFAALLGRAEVPALPVLGFGSPSLPPVVVDVAAVQAIAPPATWAGSERPSRISPASVGRANRSVLAVSVAAASS